jgi:hypothetical protein
MTRKISHIYPFLKLKGDSESSQKDLSIDNFFGIEQQLIEEKIGKIWPFL